MSLNKICRFVDQLSEAAQGNAPKHLALVYGTRLDSLDRSPTWGLSGVSRPNREALWNVTQVMSRDASYWMQPLSVLTTS